MTENWHLKKIHINCLFSSNAHTHTTVCVALLFSIRERMGREFPCFKIWKSEKK